MFRFHFTLILAILFVTCTNGQKTNNLRNLIGKTFVSSGLEYLEIINDSTLYSSINSYTDTARMFLRSDTLFTKQRYWQTDQTGTNYMEKIYDYKIIALTADTIQLKNIYRFKEKPDNWEDPLVFISIEKIKEPVGDFKFLKLDCLGPRSGARHVIIDGIGKVSFIDKPILYSINNPGADKDAKPRHITGQLTRKEFINFKNLLSRSLPSRLPFKRDCGMDGATSNFEIIIGRKRIKSIGCDLSWIHAFLLNYIYDIDQNKGLVKNTK